MQGDDAVTEPSNEVPTAGLTAINQCSLDAKMFANCGYGRLAEKSREESIGEMRDADSLLERVLHLDGLPDARRLGSIRTGEQLALALELGRAAVARLNQGIPLRAERADHGSRELLENILEGEEDHADGLEGRLAAIEQIGEGHYLAQQLHP